MEGLLVDTEPLAKAEQRPGRNRAKAEHSPNKGQQRPAKAKQRPSKGQAKAKQRPRLRDGKTKQQKHRNAWTRHPGPIGPQLALRTPMPAKGLSERRGSGETVF